MTLCCKSSAGNTFHTTVVRCLWKSVRQLCLSHQPNSDTTQRLACGPPRLSCVRASACSEISSVEFLHLVYQGFLPGFDQVLVAGLVANLYLIHVSTLAGSCFCPSAWRCHLPAIKKYNLCVNLKISSSAVNPDFLTWWCVNGVAPTTMSEVHVVATVHQRPKGMKMVSALTQCSRVMTNFDTVLTLWEVLVWFWSPAPKCFTPRRDSSEPTCAPLSTPIVILSDDD